MVLTDEESKAKGREYYYKNKEKWKSDKVIEEENRKSGLICKKNGCDHGVRTKDLCNSHYHIALRKIKEEKNRKSGLICKWEGCTRGVNYKTKGVCHDHYKASYLKEWREMIFRHLNQNKCQKCGIEDLRVLNFDHIHDDGNMEETKGQNWWKKYARDPELARKKLQVLCYNCNFLKQRDRQQLKFLSNAELRRMKDMMDITTMLNLS
jgi:hypothetical protein